MRNFGSWVASEEVDKTFVVVVLWVLDVEVLESVLDFRRRKVRDGTR